MRPSGERDFPAAGDRVEVRFEANRRYAHRSKPRPHRGFVIVHEDRDLLVVDKAPELLTVPTERGERYTLAERVSQYVRRSGDGRGAFPVHRLDRGVSGLLVLAKSPAIEKLLRDQFSARKPGRQYVAIVAGHLPKAAGEFRSYLATDKALNRFSTDDREIGQLAVTHYQVVERLADTTLVAVQRAARGSAGSGRGPGHCDQVMTPTTDYGTTIDDAVRVARVAAPYYARSLDRLRMVPDGRVPTMATSAQWVTHYNPATVATWTPSEAAAVLIHELELLLRRHAERCGDRDHGRFNAAADADINQRQGNLVAQMEHAESRPADE